MGSNPKQKDSRSKVKKESVVTNCMFAPNIVEKENSIE